MYSTVIQSTMSKIDVSGENRHEDKLIPVGDFGWVDRLQYFFLNWEIHDFLIEQYSMEFWNE